MEQKAKNVSPFSNESRNAYVVEHLTNSFPTLLREKPMNEIAVSELRSLLFIRVDRSLVSAGHERQGGRINHLPPLNRAQTKKADIVRPFL